MESIDLNNIKVNTLQVGSFRVTEPSAVSSISVGDLLNMEFPEQQWLVEGLIPASAITIFSAPPASFKTWSMTHLAVSVAKGEPFYGHFPTRQSGVLIVDEENGDRHMHHQMKMLGADKDSPIRLRVRHNFVVNEDNMRLLWLDCKTYGLKTVMFDSLADIHRADENSAAEMTRVFDHFKFLTDHDITVIVLHHNRKPGITSFGGGNEMRGSSAILASADACISLRVRGEDRLDVNVTKMRQAKAPKPFTVSIKSDETAFCFEYKGDTAPVRLGHDEQVRPAIIQLLSECDALSQKDLLEAVKSHGHKTSENPFRSLLRAMLAETDSPIKVEPGVGNMQVYSLRKQ